MLVYPFRTCKIGSTMKSFLALLALMLFCCTTVVRADNPVPTDKLLVAIGNEIRTALAKPLSIKVPTALVERPDSAFWKQPALKGQTAKWTISVPAHVFLMWTTRTDGLSDAERKAIGEMAATANFASFMQPLTESAKKANEVAGDGKALSAAIAALNAALDQVKSGGLSRTQTNAVNAFFQVLGRPAFKG